MSDTLQAGPCVICGGTNYNLSGGGPTICPKCDCGNFDAATVETQAKVISSLRQEIERLRAALAATPVVGGEVREKMARAMQGANALRMLQCFPWDGIEAPEKDHWLYLADAALSRPTGLPIAGEAQS